MLRACFPSIRLAWADSGWADSGWADSGWADSGWAGKLVGWVTRQLRLTDRREAYGADPFVVLHSRWAVERT